MPVHFGAGGGLVCVCLYVGGGNIGPIDTAHSQISTCTWMTFHRLC